MFTVSINRYEPVYSVHTETLYFTKNSHSQSQCVISLVMSSAFNFKYAFQYTSKLTCSKKGRMLHIPPTGIFDVRPQCMFMFRIQNGRVLHVTST